MHILPVDQHAVGGIVTHLCGTWGGRDELVGKATENSVKRKPFNSRGDRTVYKGLTLWNPNANRVLPDQVSFGLLTWSLMTELLLLLLLL